MKRLLLLGLLGCAPLEEKVVGMDIIQAEEPIFYDFVLGNFTYQDDAGVHYLCPECETPIDVSYALENMGLYSYLDRITDEGIDSVLSYGTWDASISEFSKEDAWINLSCSDMNILSVWVINGAVEYGMDYYQDGAEWYYDVDSYHFLNCIHESVENDCNPDLDDLARCDYFSTFSDE